VPHAFQRAASLVTSAGAAIVMRDLTDDTSGPAGTSVLPSEPAIREQLERILAGPQFTVSEGARRLLRFVVDETLAGRADRLKEYTLATEVFGREATFDPKLNPAVRVEAGRLRQRLEHYYLTLGRDDPVLIELPRGGYVPRFESSADVLHLRDHLAEVTSELDASAGDFSPTLPGGPAIAVLPFENLGSEDDRPFADGISIEILTALSRFREFRLLGRGTVFGHRGERDIPRLRAKLGAHYVLDGSIRRDAERVRVHAELVSTADGQVLWVERFDRNLSAGSMFEVEDEIATRVVTTIAPPHGVISRPEVAIARRKAPERLHSYDCLMLFYDYTAHRSAERHGAVRTVVEAETREAPDVASLWAALSMLHIDTWRFGFNVAPSREAAREQALAAARRAVELDPRDALGYHARFLAHFANGDLKAFRATGSRALELNPYNTDILADFGLHLTMCDEWRRGLFLLKLALSLNPEPPDWYWFPFFAWHFDRGEFDDALEMALRSQNPDFYWTHGMHLLAYSALGMKDEAAESLARLLEIYPDFVRQAPTELALWLGPARIERLVVALREAGLPIVHAAG
jgi:adenylate cyclase